MENTIPDTNLPCKGVQQGVSCRDALPKVLLHFFMAMPWSCAGQGVGGKVKMPAMEFLN